MAGQAWPGWIFGLWLVPVLVVETVRFVLDSREMGPSEHYDWSNWWAVSFDMGQSLFSTFCCLSWRYGGWCGSSGGA